MKILDYLTFMSIQEKSIPRGLEKFAADIECEIYALEKDSVIAICNAEKLGFKEVLEKKDKYAMCIIGRWDNGIITSSESKEELIKDYTKLVQNGIVKPKSSSSNINEIVLKTIKK